MKAIIGLQLLLAGAYSNNPFLFFAGLAMMLWGMVE
jgi:hypothetical protein